MISKNKIKTFKLCFVRWKSSTECELYIFSSVSACFCSRLGITVDFYFDVVVSCHTWIPKANTSHGLLNVHENQVHSDFLFFIYV